MRVVLLGLVALASALKPLIDSQSFLRDALPVLKLEPEDEASHDEPTNATTGGEAEARGGRERGGRASPVRLRALRYMRARQVPGDGACLFHALSAGLWLAANGTHHPLTPAELKPQSLRLRACAIDVLEDCRDPRLYMGDAETMRASKLLELAADLDAIDSKAYCAKLRTPHAWGGGPEIVALSNALQRPIHVYEIVWACCDTPTAPRRASVLAALLGLAFQLLRPLLRISKAPQPEPPSPRPPRWCLQCIAEFGSPRFDRRHAPLHILSCDSRFPDLEPEHKLDQGNHFLLLFDCDADAARDEARSDGADARGAAFFSTAASRRARRRLRDVCHRRADKLIVPFFAASPALGRRPETVVSRLAGPAKLVFGVAPAAFFIGKRVRLPGRRK
ncbi:hypothetical protein M885DRAFT_533625 [Pelagophyceae sp. CCMP2097]|nr:hypothetical protein M885DRAFT_533625 [Pelagophyceae sp. CCMP2097]